MDPQTINAMYSFNENEISEYTLSCFMLHNHGIRRTKNHFTVLIGFKYLGTMWYDILTTQFTLSTPPYYSSSSLLSFSGCGISSGNLIAYTLSFDTHYLVFNECNRFF